MRLFRPGTELKRFARNPMSRAALAVAACIPLLYGALYLWAFWNPTGHLDRLPVAIVQADAGATDSAGKRITAGQSVADTLVSDGTLDWVVTDAASATQGLAAGRYLAVLTIPTDFSAAVATAGTEQPVQAQLRVTHDDANGVTSRTIVASVMREVRTSVSDSVGETMVSSLLVGVEDLRGGLVKAADGATQVATGADSAVTGSAKLADGTNQVATGAETAHQGSIQLAAGATKVADGASALATGLPAAQQGAASLASGAGELNAGGTKLASGLHAAATQAQTLPGSTTKLAQGAAQVSSGLTTLSDTLDTNSGKLTTSTAQVRALLAAELPAGSPALAAFDAYSKQVGGSFSQVSDAVTSLEAGAGQVSAGASSLATATSGTASGLQQAAEGADALGAGAAKLQTGASTLESKLGEAATGARSLSSGAATLASSSTELSAGLGSLAEGATSTHEGAAQLNEGLVKLADGSHELASQLSEAAAGVPALSSTQRDANSTVMSAPVTLDTAYVHEAAGVGEGMAPYFIGLSLYVGAMILWMLLRPISQRLLAAPVPASRVVALNLTPGLLVGGIQVGLLLSALVLGLGLDVNHLGAFIGFGLLVSAAFVTLQQALNVWFGTSVGRLVTIVLLMLQLTSAGGTYPVSTSDPFFQALHVVMPMTQVVNGFREAITGDLNAQFWTATGSLGLLVLASVLASVWGASRSRTWTLARLHPAIAL